MLVPAVLVRCWLFLFGEGFAVLVPASRSFPVPVRLPTQAPCRPLAEAAFVSRRTTVPLSQSNNNTSPGREVAQQAAHLPQFSDTALFTPQPDGCTANAPIHKWRIPSSTGTHVPAPGSTDRHTPSALMAHPPAPHVKQRPHQKGPTSTQPIPTNKPFSLPQFLLGGLCSGSCEGLLRVLVLLSKAVLRLTGTAGATRVQPQ